MDIVVPPVKEEIEDAAQTAMEMYIVEVFQLSRQERIQQRIQKQRGNALRTMTNRGSRCRSRHTSAIKNESRSRLWIPQSPDKDEIAEVVPITTQESTQERIAKQIVDTPVPADKEEIAEVVPMTPH